MAKLVHIRQGEIPRVAICGDSPAIDTLYVDEVQGRVKVCRDCAWRASAVELPSLVRTIRAQATRIEIQGDALDRALQNSRPPSAISVIREFLSLATAQEGRESR